MTQQTDEQEAMSLHICGPSYIILVKAFDLGFIDLIFLWFPRVGSFKSGNHCTRGQGIGFSSTKDRRDSFLTLLLFGD